MPKFFCCHAGFWKHAETKISAGPSRITRPAELNEVVVVMVQYYSNTFLAPKNINMIQIISKHFLRSARSVFGFRTNRDGQDGQDGRGISNTQTSSNDDNINRSRGHVGFLFRINAPFSRSFVPPPICHISTFKVSFSYMCFLFYS